MEFAFAFEPQYRGLLLPLGVTPGNSRVTITDDDVIAVRFGPWKLKVPVSNVAGTYVTADYRWYRAIGIRGSLADYGITFGTNTHGGVCVEFHEPVQFLPAPRRFHHPNMTLTLEDIDGFVEELAGRMM